MNSFYYPTLIRILLLEETIGRYFSPQGRGGEEVKESPHVECHSGGVPKALHRWKNSGYPHEVKDYYEPPADFR